MKRFIDIKRFSVPRYWFYRITAVVIAAIFILFFSSNMWLTVATEVYETSIGYTSQLDNDTTLTLKSWKYNADEKFMDVNIGIDCKYVDVDYSFNVYATDNLGRSLDTYVAYSNLEFMVLNLSGIPNCDSVNVVVTLLVKGDLLTSQDSSAEVKTQSLSTTFTLTFDSIETDNSLSTDLTEDEYIIRNWEYDIDVLEIQVQELQASIRENNTKIFNSQSKISELEDSKAYKIDDEVLVIDEQIEKLNSVIETAQESTLTAESGIVKLQSKISGVQMKIEAYTNKTPMENNSISEHSE